MPLIDPTKFGGPAIDLAAFQWLIRSFPKGGTLLELGSGTSTEELCKFFDVISVEDNEEWVGIAPSAKYIHAPPVKFHSPYEFVQRSHAEAPETSFWYDPEVLKRELEGLHYDILLIDGPYWGRQRIGILEHIELFRTDCAFLIDDAGRKAEGTIMRVISDRVGRPWHKIRGSHTKEFGVIPLEGA